MASAWGAKTEIKDFIVEFWKKPERPQSSDDMRAFFLGLTKAMGGKIE